MFSAFCQKHKLMITYSLLLLLTILFICINNRYTYFWFDEGFSISLIKYSYSEIWQFTAEDVHPPLYYFMLKAYASLVGGSVANLRFFSAIPILLTVIVGCTLIRKLWGDKVAISFIVIMFFSPLIYYMTSEIRMYSWSMFFVLMAFLCAYVSYIQNSKKCLLYFLLFSLAAGYSHYYALVAVGGIYILYFIVALLGDKKKLAGIIIAGVLFALGYLPWLLFFVTQLKNVSEDYWILPFDPVLIFFESIYIFSSLKETNFYPMYIREVEVGVFVLFVLLLFVNLTRKGGSRDRIEVLSLIFIFLFPLLFGIVFSLIIKPIFITRYINTFVGPLFLGLAILVSKVDLFKTKNVFLYLPFVCFFLVLSMLVFYHKVSVKRFYSVSVNSIELFVNENRDGETVFLYRDSVFLPMGVYTNIFPDNIHISKKDSLPRKDRAVVDIFDLMSVDSYQAIDTIYKHAYILGHHPNLNSSGLMRSRRDSLELDMYFEIVRKANINDTELFELRRK